jgi:uncharacterized protein
LPTRETTNDSDTRHLCIPIWIPEVQVITTADLKAQTRRELADLARDYGVPGWHALKKDELILEISKVQRRMRRKSQETKGKSSGSKSNGVVKSPGVAKSNRAVAVKPNGLAAGLRTTNGSDKALQPKTTAKSKSSELTSRAERLEPSVPAVSLTPTAKPAPIKRPPSSANSNRPLPKLPEPKVSAKTARIRAQIRQRRETMERNKDLSTATLVGGAAVQNGSRRSKSAEPHQDRVILLVRDSYWLQASWEITRASIERAQSSLAERWHTAVPTLRLLAVGDVSSNCAEVVSRDITIHGGVDNWYIDVDEPPSRFRVLIGYVSDNGEFYTVVRSNIVETPRPGECERLDEHWRDIAEDYERIYSLSGGYETDGGDLKELFEERLRRPMPQRGDQGQTVADPTLLRQAKLPFEVEAELIIFGKTIPAASVMVSGRPVKLQPDGSFTVRMELPDKRQVLPITAESRDGLRQRTTVIAVERNTKVMEAVELDDRL